MHPPIFIDVFMQPIRDNKVAQVAFMAFCFLMVLDILLGYAAAVKTKTVKSAKMREGLWHKTGEMGIIAVGDVLDGMLLGGINMPFSAPVTTAMIVYLAINEAVSCMENIVKLDPELGDKRFFRVLMATLSDASDKPSDGDGAHDAA
jgi:phage-related holin